MKRFLDGFRIQILTLIIFPFSLLILILAVMGVQVHQDAMRRLVAERDERSVRAAAAAISQQLHHRESAIIALALRARDGNEPQSVLDQANFLWGDYDQGLAISDLDGIVLANTESAESWTSSPVGDLTVGLNEGEVRFTHIFPEDGAGPIVIIAARKGELIAMGAFTVTSLMRTATLGSLTDLQSYSAFLTDRSGRVLTSIGSPLPDDQMSTHPGVQAALRGETGSSYLPAEDGEHVVAFSPIIPSSWALIIEEPWEVVASPVLNLSLAAPLALIPALGVMLIALWFGSRQIVSPLRQLEQQASKLARGDHEAIEEPVGGIAEIQLLQQTMVGMMERIAAAQNALRGYIKTMTTTQEDERRRLARELHDETIQDLIALGQQVQILGVELKKDGVEKDSEIRGLHKSTQESIERVRRFSRGLRPIYLEELGLITALQMIARDAELDLGIPVDFRSEGQIRRIDPDSELALYRIVQEALSNIGRHAQASHVWINVIFDDGGLAVHIRDNGVGFDVPERITDMARNEHFGLIGMVERAMLIDAKLSIHSQPEQGAEIVARLTLDGWDEKPE